MNRSIRIFIDSDVIISSLLSKFGVSHALVTKTNLQAFISNISHKELKLVAKRLKISQTLLENLVKNKLKQVNLGKDLKATKSQYKAYTTDQNDTHVVTGALKANAQFLITYNLRDYKTDKIKQDFGIICLTPGQFLQYLRSL